MDKILTIVIPTYNMEKFLRRCLDSLIISDKTLFEKLEVLVVNDGSKDSSSKIAHEYEDKYPNVFRVIDKENGNYGSCVNRGLKESKGKYIKILDADDSYKRDCLYEYLLKLQDSDADLIINDCDILSVSGGKIDEFSYSLPKNQSDKIIIPLTIQMHCVAYKTNNLREINYTQTEGISYTDQEWIFMPMTTVNSIYYIKVPLYDYYVGREGQTMDPNVYLRNFWQEITIIKRMLSQFYSAEISFGKAKQYMYEKIEDRIRTLFKNVLVIAGCCQSNDLIEFDKFLSSEYPHFYNDVVMNIHLSRQIPFRFIKYWCNNGYQIPKNHPILIVFRYKNIYRKVCNLLSFSAIKSLIHK